MGFTRRLRMRRRDRADPEDRGIRRHEHSDLLRRWLVQRRFAQRHRCHPAGRRHPVWRRPAPAGLVRHPGRHCFRATRPTAQRRSDRRPRRGPGRARSGPKVRRPTTNRRPPERRRGMTEREDRQDIADVLMRYATGIDRRDWPLFRTVFTDDCELDYGEAGSWQGADAVTEFMQRAHELAGRRRAPRTSHVRTADPGAADINTYVDTLKMLTKKTSRL